MIASSMFSFVRVFHLFLNLRLGLHALAALPFAYLAWHVWQGSLGVDPAEALLHQSGVWSLRLLCITLVLTPLRQMGWRPALRYRRLLGLWSFFYACLHLMVYLLAYQEWTLAAWIDAWVKRPFMVFGASAWSILFVLAVTSLPVAMRRLGGRWLVWHRFVYIALVAVLVHYFLAVKADVTLPVVYALLALFLLLWRFRL